MAGKIATLDSALSIPLLQHDPLLRMDNPHPSLASVHGIENPAARLLDVFDESFLRISGEGLILDTTKTRQHYKTLAEGPVSADIVWGM